MSETELLLRAATILAFVCAVSTALLWVVPTPEKIKDILVLPDTPLWYIRLYNVLRYLSGNRGWTERKNGNGTKP